MLSASVQTPLNRGMSVGHEGLAHLLPDFIEEACHHRKEDDGRAVLRAIHYPPFSGASNFPERGNPNLGPTKHTRVLKPLAKILQEAFKASKLYPDAVFSAHAHHYQRLTYRCADGREIPYLIVGSGGHAPVESLAERCDGGVGRSPRRPHTIPRPF